MRTSLKLLLATISFADIRSLCLAAIIIPPLPAPASVSFGAAWSVTRNIIEEDEERAKKRADEEWRPMETAPRDGTIIEIQNNYGVQPWYDIYQWSDVETVPYYEAHSGEPGKTESIGSITRKCDPKWVSRDRVGHSLDPADERYFKWRPYHKDGEYVDPTGGAQFTPGYWR